MEDSKSVKEFSPTKSVNYSDREHIKIQPNSNLITQDDEEENNFQEAEVEQELEHDVANATVAASE